MNAMKTPLICSLLAAYVISTAQAQFYDWEGGVSDDWLDNLNWENDQVIGAGDTARIYNSDISTPSVPNNTVLKTGGIVSLLNVWIGNSGDPLESGNLTVESGASLTTTNDFVINNNSRLTSSGAISVGNGNGIIVRDTGHVTLNSGSTLNKLTLSENSTATLNSGSSVTTLSNLANSASLTLNTTYTGNLSAFNDSSIAINGTFNGDFTHGSTAMSSVGAGGLLNGSLSLSQSDQMTIDGEVSGGLFNINSTASLVLGADAVIESEGTASWIYNTAAITWNVGADGSVATMKTDRNETSAGAFDGEWRYDTTVTDLLVILDDYEIDGETITLQLVSGIQKESTFADNVTFMLNGEDVTSDFTWNGAGTGSFDGIVVPEPSTYALLAGCFGLTAVMLRRRRA